MRVAIIGGGVIGLTTAYALINKGHQVDVYEQNDDVGMATSFANGGQLSYRYVTPLADAGVPWQALGWMMKKDSPLRFRPRMSLEQWHWCWQFLQACRTAVNQANTAHLLRLALHSQSVLHHWQAQGGLNDFGWRANGKMVIYRQQQAFKHAASKITASSPQQVLSAQECVAAEPSLAHLAPQLQGGIFSPGDEVGDCYLFCQQLLQQLNAHPNFTLHSSHTVDKLMLEQGKVRGLKVTHTQDSQTHQVDVEHLVVAAGMGSKEILNSVGIKVPLYPLKGYSLTLPVTDNSTVPHTNVTDYDRKIVYARLKDQLRVAAMVDIGQTTTALDAGRIASLRQQAKLSFPHAGDYQEATAWAGLRPATPQGTPLLGRSGVNNLWLNLGHGSLGFTLACGSADCLAQLIDNEPTAIALTGLQR
ncbi:D-amino acid dehydrogenase [Oceanisphaera pacifica]|uniref:D-amino acid dehydrogenase n=1 Tax=Oceanisphaera pacifica TaxID=2818389 RepID=A0ABS3NEP3_9GAMM|nr:D-amino acid dehydrogenase [Oceanisphaera pacifica]MBO1519054.1 D-amino acid dehydrogenase [Oceanisphaera pacifica]